MSYRAPFWSPAEASAILFDWDGVIAETQLDFSGIYKKYYDGKRAMLLEDAATLPPETRDALMQDLRELEVRGAYGAKRVPGISRILEWVASKEIPWAVVSRNCRESIAVAAESCGVRLPEIVRSRDDGTAVKPDPRALFETCGALGVPPSQTLFIGDFIYDMIGARRAGMRGVLVRRAIDPDWSPWLECAYTSMDQLAGELRAPSQMIPWEYQETVERFGRAFLEKNFSRTLAVPTNAQPDIATWVATAATLGVGTFAVPDEKLTPQMWKENRLFDTEWMGLPLRDALGRFLRTRFPFVAVRPQTEDEIDERTSPVHAEDLEKFLRAG